MYLLILLLLLSPLPPAAAPSAAVTLAPVGVRTFTETLAAYGVIDPDPDQVTTVSLPHAGLVDRVWVRPGQRIARGDRLLELVTAPEAWMQYLQARSNLDYARRNLERVRRLYGEQLATRGDLDAARRDLAAARVALEALQQRAQDLQAMTLAAPRDGIVIRVDLTQGQQAAAGAGALLIADPNRLVARLGVEPEDLDRLRVGTEVTIHPVFTPAWKIRTQIREIHAMIDPATRLVEVLAPIPPSQTARLILSSQVVGRIRLASRTALAVPRSAVLRAEGGAYVFTVSHGKARKTAVETGLEEGDWVEIRAGLAAGAQVVTLGNYELRDGMAVREAAP